MNSKFEYNKWHKDYMKEKRAPEAEEIRKRKLLKQGKCPLSEILLTSRFHKGCKCGY